jgi:hypothetical protein
MHTFCTCDPLCRPLVSNNLAPSCNKIAEAEAAVSVKERKLLVMHMHVQLKLDIAPSCGVGCLFKKLFVRLACLRAYTTHPVPRTIHTVRRQFTPTVPRTAIGV